MIADYTIQSWLFSEAHGKFDVDLGESGVQFHYLNDLKVDNCHLNYDQDCGDIALREEVAKLYGVDAEIPVITHGSQEALYLIYNSLLKARDHIICTVPGWQQSWAVPEHLGCTVTKVTLARDEGYQLNPEKIAEAFLPNTKAIVINNPNNPTGAKYDNEALNKVVELARKRGIYIISDEEYLTSHEDSLVHSYERAVVVQSLSKVYGFPGLRIGWLVTRDSFLRSQALNYKRYVTVSNSSLCSTLAVQVLQNRKKFEERYHRFCDEGMALTQAMLKDVPELELLPLDGVPYVYLGLNIDVSSSDFAKRLLRDHKTLVMPAEVFEDKQAIRVSIARHAEILTSGLNNIIACIESHKK